MLRALLLAQALVWCGSIEEEDPELLAAPATYVDVYRAAAERSGALAQPSAEWTRAATAALASGDSQRAARLAAEALALDPEDARALDILKLTERKEGPSLIEAAALPTSFSAAPERQPAPQALSLMGRALEARRAGDQDGAQGFALQAVRADPTSPQVQDLYRAVTADRVQRTARVRATLSYLEASGRAREEGRFKDALRLAQKAAQTDPSPATFGFLEHLTRELGEPPPSFHSFLPWLAAAGILILVGLRIRRKRPRVRS